MKTVMFIPLGFYDYDDKIEEEIVKLGYEVTRFTPHGRYTIIDKLLNVLTGGRHAENKALRRQKKILLREGKQYDYVFVIVGRDLAPEVLGEFRKKQPKAKFILYLWDDIDRIKGFEENKKFYDEIYSFAIKDIEKYGIQFLPLFYTEMHEYHNEEKRYLLNMSGALHSERLEIWEKVAAQCRLHPSQCFLYLVATTASQLFQALLPSKNPWLNRKYVHLRNMKFQMVTESMKQSKAALDVQFNLQTGLTMRTLESLAAHTKLITTNEYVRDYDFYQYGNIYIIDRENPVVSREFLESEYREVPPEIVKKYSLSNWVAVMFGKDS